MAALGAVLAAPATSAVSAAAHPPPDEPAREVHGRIAVATPAEGTTRSAPPPIPCDGGSTALPGAGWTIDGVAPGRAFALTADAGSWRDDFDITFFASLAACQAGGPQVPFWTHAGDEHAVVPAGASVAVVSMNAGVPGASFTYVELGQDTFQPALPDERRPTVVAVLDEGFSPYNNDFLGDKHPWNTDGPAGNDIDFDADPATYLPGYPGSTPIQLHFPGNDTADTTPFAEADRTARAQMEATRATGPAHLYRFPGTKIVGAIRFSTSTAEGSGDFYDDKDAHGTAVASVAAGNVRGTCPECVLVLVGIGAGLEAQALQWAAAQPWIDVVVNSYGLGVTPTTYDKIYLGHGEPGITKAATESGQTVFWSSGNGLDDKEVVPNSTYWSAEKGPDWIVDVGSINSITDQPQNGAGKPVDLASYGDSYPAAAGKTLNGSRLFTGTSNAAPVAAGTFATLVQRARDVLGDTTPGHAAGVVASGRPQPCPLPALGCPLRDGRLTRAEAQDLLFANVLPAPPRQFRSRGVVGNDTVNASRGTPVPAPVSQGHGVVYGRIDPGRFVAEQRHLTDALRGLAPPYRRPPGERGWMTADSLCRQRLWGTWDGGYYDGRGPAAGLGAKPDAAAIALTQACSAVPQDLLLRAAEANEQAEAAAGAILQGAGAAARNVKCTLSDITKPAGTSDPSCP